MTIKNTDTLTPETLAKIRKEYQDKIEVSLDKAFGDLAEYKNITGDKDFVLLSLFSRLSDRETTKQLLVGSPERLSDSLGGFLNGSSIQDNLLVKLLLMVALRGNITK